MEGLLARLKRGDVLVGDGAWGTGPMTMTSEPTPRGFFTVMGVSVEKEVAGLPSRRRCDTSALTRDGRVKTPSRPRHGEFSRPPLPCLLPTLQ